MTYSDHFKLDGPPFTNAPMSAYYFDSPQHARAARKLLHAFDNMLGLAICTGDIGTGKTTLSRRMLRNLPSSKYEAALLVIVHSGITAQWLVKRIALQLGIKQPAEDKLTLLSQLYRRLLEIYKEGRRAIVMIDEAQMLDTREMMEEFRGLLNLEIPGHKLVTFAFFGLPELSEVLKIDEPLRQRVAVHCRLSRLDEKASASYVKHRLSRCGCEKDIFSEDALAALHRYSGGTPRLINTLADNALFEAAELKLQLVGAEQIRQAAMELEIGAMAENSISDSSESVENLDKEPDGLEDFDRLMDELERY